MYHNTNSLRYYLISIIFTQHWQNYYQGLFDTENGLSVLSVLALFTTSNKGKVYQNPIEHLHQTRLVFYRVPIPTGNIFLFYDYRFCCSGEGSFLKSFLLGR
jgi:hypothetical protein